jgi:DNA repair exonuclease SbcCD nuclease subunit
MYVLYAGGLMRRKTKSSYALFVGDLHLKEKAPASRTDEWLKAMAEKLNFISKISREHNATIIQVGDLFDSAKNSNLFLSYVLTYLPYMTVVPGNHDLPGNTMNNFERSPLNILLKANSIAIGTHTTCSTIGNVKIHYFPYGDVNFEEKDKYSVFPDHNNIAVLHHPIYSGQVPFYHKNYAVNVNQIRKYFPEFDWVVAGDIHSPFVNTRKKPYVLNCGSVLRLTSVQKEYKPAIWLMNLDTLEVKKIEIPVQENVMSEDSEKIENKKSESLAAFVEHFRPDKENGFLQYEEYIEKYLKENKVQPAVKKAIKNIMAMEEK